MKTYLECVPCMAEQAVNTLSICDCDAEKKESLLLDIISGLANIDYSSNPAKNSNFIYKDIAEHTGIEDPFYKLKRRSNQQAKRVFPRLKEIVKNSKDPLISAVKVAIAGNAIDLGINFSLGSSLKPENILDEIEELEFGINDYDLLLDRLTKTKKILYMADNAGEIVFDRVLVEQLKTLGKEVTLSVKSGPIINDANMEDALEAEFGKEIDIIETGNNNIDSDIDYFSKEFRNIFESVDLIICKGQAHFESLDNYRGPIFFLLKCKCPIIARELGTEVSKIAFCKSNNFREQSER